MPGTLRELIMASTGVTALAGESGRVDVTGAASLATAREYLLNGISWSGQPDLAYFGGYADAHAFAMVATFDRNARFYHIQQNLLNRWSISVTDTSFSPVAGASGILSAFSSAGSPAGATHSLTATIRGAFNGTPSASPNYSVAEPADPFFDPWPTTWISGVSGGTPSGQSLLRLQLSYNPDRGGFNTAVATNWDFYMNNRAYEMEVNWFKTLAHYNAAVAGTAGWEMNIVSTAASINPSGITGIFPTSDLGLYLGESATLWLRYRSAGGSWTNHGAVVATN